MGDAASWKPSWNGYAMEIYRIFTCNLTLTKLYKVLLISRL